ncbi:hypothetical protein EDB84DRAFT_1442449 [Lactarius hengduanensis]|nr:hypothetical protein EDB84DRAFT_1442449 [Lactarius hengduanensis]
MVIHRRLPLGVTATSTIHGYLWGRWPCRSITHSFDANLPAHDPGSTIDPPYVDVEGAFFLPSNSQPEVFDTLIRVAGHTLLVSAYFDRRVGQNPNLKRDFPLIPWYGEIAVLFVGKRKPYVSRAPSDSVVRFAIAQYMGLCVAHVELGIPLPAHLTSQCYDPAGSLVRGDTELAVKPTRDRREWW